MTDVSLDPRDMKTKPCTHCLAIIDDAANAMEDDDFISYIEDDPSDLVSYYREDEGYD